VSSRANYVAIKDPGARRITISYTGGKVSGPKGLIEYFWNKGGFPSGPYLHTGPGGRKVIRGLSRSSSAAAGKELYLTANDGHTYKIHYSGKFRDWYTYCYPFHNTGTITRFRTARGRKGA